MKMFKRVEEKPQSAFSGPLRHSMHLALLKLGHQSKPGDHIRMLECLPEDAFNGTEVLASQEVLHEIYTELFGTTQLKSEKTTQAPVNPIDDGAEDWIEPKSAKVINHLVEFITAKYDAGDPDLVKRFLKPFLSIDDDPSGIDSLHNHSVAKFGTIRQYFSYLDLDHYSAGQPHSYPEAPTHELDNEIHSAVCSDAREYFLANVKAVIFDATGESLPVEIINYDTLIDCISFDLNNELFDAIIRSRFQDTILDTPFFEALKICIPEKASQIDAHLTVQKILASEIDIK